MPKRRVLTCRELIKLLKDYDNRFVIFTKRGKGSERMIYHPDVKGSARSYPLPCHGEGATVRKGHLVAIRRRFELPALLFDNPKRSRTRKR